MKKQIGHMIMVSLKFFFDFDPSITSHLFIVGIILISLVKFFFSNITAELHDGLLTVKSDTMGLIEEIATYPQKWENSNLREAMVNNARAIRENLTDIDLRGWRLK